MKRKVEIIIAVLFLTISNFCFSHGECRNKTTNSGVFLEAKAKVNSITFWYTQIVTSSNPSGDITANASISCAWQKSRNSAGGHSFQGAVKKNYCARGYEKSSLAASLADLSDDDYEEALERCDLAMDGQSISGSDITIYNIRGYMDATLEMISSYSIKVWLPASESDTTVNEDELLYYGNIMIIDGNVVLEGNFIDDMTPAMYTDSTIGDYKRVRFLGGDLSISVPLPTGSSMEDVVLITESDGKHNDDYAVERALSITENLTKNHQFRFDVAPVPTSSTFNITFSLPNPGDVEVKIFGVDGRLVEYVLNQKVAESEIISVKAGESLPSGIYYIYISDGERKLIRKVAKE